MDKSANITQVQDPYFLGSGWSFPVSFSAGNYQLSISSFTDSVKECIQVIINTRMGERSMLPSFGSGLENFMFKTMNENLKSAIEYTIKDALLDYEPRITVENVEADFDLENAIVQINIDYIYNQTNTRHNYVFPYNLKEGTNL